MVFCMNGVFDPAFGRVFDYVSGLASGLVSDHDVSGLASGLADDFGAFYSRVSAQPTAPRAPQRCRLHSPASTF